MTEQHIAAWPRAAWLASAADQRQKLDRLLVRPGSGGRPSCRAGPPVEPALIAIEQDGSRRA